jgi:hypothetical protein
MSAADLATFAECTGGRTDPPAGGSREAWLVVGRRGGKSLILSAIAVYLAAFVNWRKYLVAGERATIVVIAADRKQARVIFRYVAAFLKETVLAELVERETADTLDLTNGVSVEIQTCSFKTIRGYSIAACLADEAAFWSVDGVSPDVEVLGAVRPAMLTFPNAMMLVASSPYAKRGALYEAYRKHYGKAGDPILVWQAPTLTMNPTASRDEIDKEIEADPAKARAEYFAEFRSDIEAFISRETVERSVIPGRIELPPIAGINYVAAVDPAGGNIGGDSMTLAIAHKDLRTERVVIDAVREWRPEFSPDQVCRELAAVCKSYRIFRITGDHWGSLFVREPLMELGLHYMLSPAPKSEVYVDALALLNSGKLELPDIARVTNQICGLERKVSRGGKDSIDHAPGQHDDLANSVLLAALLANRDGGRPRISAITIDLNPRSSNAITNWLA